MAETDKNTQVRPAKTSSISLSTLLWRYHFWLIALMSAALISACAWFIDDNNNKTHLQKSRTAVQNQLSTIRARLEGKLNGNIQAVNGLISAISIEPNMTQERFAQFARPLIEANNQLRNIAAAPNMVIRLIHPIEGNKQAIGLSYLENEKQRLSAITARDSGQLVLAGPVNLVQGGRGFIGRIPVYSDNMVKGEKRFWGLVSAVIDTDKLYEASGLLDKDIPLDIAIFGQDKRISSGNTFYGDDTIFSKDPVIAFIELPFGKWQLAAIPKNGWPSIANNAWKLRLALLVVSLCILAPILLFTWTNNERREQQLRLKALFELSPIGIALNDFETGEYLSVNNRLAEDTGYTLQELERLSYWDLTPKKYQQDEEKQIESLNKTGFYGPYEKEYINKQGEVYPILLNGVLIQDSKGRNLIWSFVQNISQQKQVEKRLKDNNQQLELIIEATQVGIWDWKIQTGELSLNERWAKIIGYTLEELGEISIETWLSHAHADDLEESGNKLQAHWDGLTEEYIFECRMNHRNGNVIWVLDTGKVIEWDKDNKPIRMVGTHLDITEKKLAEKNLAQTNESLESQVRLVKTIASAQREFIKNTDYKSAFKNLLNSINLLTESELSFIGDVYYDKGQACIKLITFNSVNDNIIHPDLETSFSKNGLSFTKPDNLFVESVNSQTVLFLNNPELKFNESNLPEHHPEINNYISIPIIQKGVCIGVIGLANREMGYDSNLANWLSPLTNTVGQLIERVATIKEKEKTELALIEAKNDAESAGRAKTEFLATMSHEIRTPMNGVLGMLTLLQRSSLTPDQLKKIDIAKISAESLLSIINDVLDFTKVESGKLELEKVEFNIRTLIDDICQSMALRIQEKNIELIIDSSELDDIYIIADPVRLRQILTNLIGNAGKFTSDGEIIVRSHTNKNNGELILHCEIEDTGIGIPSNQISKLFTSFTQVDASTTRKFGGTGLGLSICKRICELMGGSIKVKSEENKGSCFSFSIPVTASQSKSNISNSTLFENMNVLVIHGNHTSSKAIERQLTQWKCKTKLASNGSDALEVIKNGDKFEVILIDADLNDINGIDLCEKIKTHQLESTSRFILMTTINQVPSDAEINAAGFHDHFAKPITTQDLLLSFKTSDSQLSISSTDPEHEHFKSNNKIIPSHAHILLVEDIPFNQEVALMLLEEMGATADVAHNGQEAVDKYKAALKEGKAYNTILMDCQMPIMDGYDATRKIRELETHTDKKSHIIAMTANAMSSD
ncbi:MAG: PAS domain S-box protein, partial [Bermanella sp.]